jgi:hypothetical protein
MELLVNWRQRGVKWCHQQIGNSARDTSVHYKEAYARTRNIKTWEICGNIA